MIYLGSSEHMINCRFHSDNLSHLSRGHSYFAAEHFFHICDSIGILSLGFLYDICMYNVNLPKGSYDRNRIEIAKSPTV